MKRKKHFPVHEPNAVMNREMLLNRRRARNGPPDFQCLLAAAVAAAGTISMAVMAAGAVPVAMMTAGAVPVVSLSVTAGAIPMVMMTAPGIRIVG